MKNHFTANLFIGLFLLLCLIPSLGMLVLGPSPLLANESAPRTPALLDREGVVNPDVLTDVTDYTGTRFALRPFLVSARSFLYEKLLNSSDSAELNALNARMSRDISQQIETRLKELAEQVEIPL